jgi:hypothetical protein
VFAFIRRMALEIVPGRPSGSNSRYPFSVGALCIESSVAVPKLALGLASLT